MWGSGGTGPAGVDTAVDPKHNVALTQAWQAQTENLVSGIPVPCAITWLSTGYCSSLVREAFGEACSTQEEHMVVQRLWGRGKFGVLAAARGSGIQRRKQDWGTIVNKSCLNT